MHSEAIAASVEMDTPVVDHIDMQIDTVNRKIVNLKEYRDRLVKCRILMTEQPETATPKVRNIMDSAMHILRGRGSVRITWLVGKLSHLKREGETHKAFYKTVHASLTGNARRENARVRIPKRGMVAAIAV